MQFLCGDTQQLEESISSRARTSNSKRGIQVTLFKEKSFSKDSHSDEKQNNNHDRFNSNPTQIARFSSNQSVQEDLISSYFEKTHQKQCVKKQSAVLDEQIKKLQMEIYNTRTKITEAKYFAKKQSQTKLLDTIKNSKKSKDKGKSDEVMTKSNKSLKSQNHQNAKNQKKGQSYVCSSEVYTQINNKTPNSVIHNTKSPTKFMRSQERSRSPSPPHPAVLREIISSTKKSNSKHHHFQNNSEIHRKDISLTEQPTHKFSYNNSSDLTYDLPNPRFNKQYENNEEHNLGLNSISAQERNQKHTKNPVNPQSRKPKTSKPKKVSTKKRSMSAYSSNPNSSNLEKPKKFQQKILNKSSEQFVVKRKSKVSDFNIDLEMHLNNLTKTKNVNSLVLDTKNNQNAKNKKGKKQVFSNELLTKAYNLAVNHGAKANKVQDDKKLKQKRKKSSKKLQSEVQRYSTNLIAQSTKIHQLVNNSSHHSTIKSKYMKPRNPFY